MQPRMNNPALLNSDAMKALGALNEAAKKGNIPTTFHELLCLRASQINGCSVCIDGHWRIARKAGETDERLFAVAAWRDTPYFTAAERAALALTEAMTQLSDRDDPVPDKIWDELIRHYNETDIVSLLLTIATINVWNRLNIATKQQAGFWKP
ncbi:carboxymuconolactone decarboxylase family protein [Afipia felis]|uniref:Argininosuccinate synthase n=2 Tax=Afipia felis TaxID=1035 RepID=A0A380W6D5_AFIFE|nr:carboxymuconolactone decarboxylase family protein [Afipia felis]EKS30914.1 alkylhydroperoxidase AhpD family core domain-containing protein [Afipia felis ATCC 53690]SUU75658.1 Argininosuccinate synthase [Afipia felis]SUU83725.1 Argininosuccinate synthase [Afipia felis]